MKDKITIDRTSLVSKLVSEIPKEILDTLKTLTKQGYKAYIVGGCVRDLMLHKKPKDWDITTNATPEQIMSLFTNTFYENKFGTVGVVIDNVSDETLKTVEITPFRKESGYSDHRHPDIVDFSDSIEEDLARRDFTINSLALSDTEFVDLFDGLTDLKNSTIKAVGNPDLRFQEDALRILRAIRLSAQLSFMINVETLESIVNHETLITKISRERIRDEFIKLINSDEPLKGLYLAQKTNVLKHIIPELTEAVGIEQNQAHSFDVFEHLVRSLQHAADKKWPEHIRLAALLHDIGKPESRRKSHEKGDWTFYGHEVIGARMAKNILENLKFPKKTIETVVKLVRWHMFFSDTETITLSAVRRLIVNVGKELIWDLMDLRVCDRIGTGRPKENPYRLRKYRSMIEEALRDPISVSMLKIDGNSVMKHVGITGGPKIGYILHTLLEEVLEEPKKNEVNYLEKRVLELKELTEIELKILGEKGKEAKDEVEQGSISDIKKKHGVQ